MIKSWSRRSSPYSLVVFQNGFIAGDPTILGWTTFAFYLVVAFLCLRNKTRKREASDSRPANRAWGWHALSYSLLGLNKQLDLQTSINAFGRQLTGAIGWYEHRRELQTAFCVAVLFLTGVYLLRNVKGVNRFMRDKPLLAIGDALVAAYLLIRTISIEHADERLIGIDLENTPGLWLLEVGGLAVFTSGLIRNALQQRLNQVP